MKPPLQNRVESGGVGIFEMISSPKNLVVSQKEGYRPRVLRIYLKLYHGGQRVNRVSRTTLPYYTTKCSISLSDLEKPYIMLSPVLLIVGIPF